MVDGRSGGLPIVYINFVNISKAHPGKKTTSTQLTLIMRFTQQIIRVATFALFSLRICAYANPMENQRDVSGLLFTRDEASWCAGFSDQECTEHCQQALGNNAKGTCNPEYVKLKF